MSLEMRSGCERCEAALTEVGIAFIRSYECTFCAGCTTEMGAVCSSCGSKLVARPRRLPEKPQQQA